MIVGGPSGRMLGETRPCRLGVHTEERFCIECSRVEVFAQLDDGRAVSSAPPVANRGPDGRVPVGGGWLLDLQARWATVDDRSGKSLVLEAFLRLSERPPELPQLGDFAQP